MFQHTAARRRLEFKRTIRRPYTQRFNTQPPEGGWEMNVRQFIEVFGFNTQPPEGGWFCVNAVVTI